MRGITTIRKHGSWYLWSCLAPIFLIFYFWWTQALYGFNPTDDGFILSQSWRVIHGQIPHLDFTSPRPLGSAYLHAPITLLPTGMLAASRLFVVFQFYWIARMSVSLIAQERIFHNHFYRFCAIFGVFTLNTGVWPIMAWHTIDGIFIGISSLAWGRKVLESEKKKVLNWIGPLLLAGAAPLMKQGFILVPIILLAFVFFSNRKIFMSASLVASIPMIVYAIIVRDTPHSFLSQLDSGSRAEYLLPILNFRDGLNAHFNFLALFLILWSTLFILAITNGNKWLLIVVEIGSVISLYSYSAFVRFEMIGDWSVYALCTMIVLVILNKRRTEFVFPVMAVVGLAIAASVSWGVTNPGLLGGTIFLQIICLMSAFTELRPDSDSVKLKFSACLLTLLMVMSNFSNIARSNVYYEGAKDNLVGSVNLPQFKLIKMSVQSAMYINSVHECLIKYPANRVAVVPDGPGLYPLLGVQSPFPNDWWLPAEGVGDRKIRMQATVNELNRESHWLVLIQSFPLSTLSQMETKQLSGNGVAFFHDIEDSEYLSNLIGEPVSCNSLSGIFRSDEN